MTVGGADLHGSVCDGWEQDVIEITVGQLDFRERIIQICVVETAEPLRSEELES